MGNLRWSSDSHKNSIRLQLQVMVDSATTGCIKPLPRCPTKCGATGMTSGRASVPGTQLRIVWETLERWLSARHADINGCQDQWQLEPWVAGSKFPGGSLPESCPVVLFQDSNSISHRTPPNRSLIKALRSRGRGDRSRWCWFLSNTAADLAFHACSDELRELRQIDLGCGVSGFGVSGFKSGLLYRPAQAGCPHRCGVGNRLAAPGSASDFVPKPLPRPGRGDCRDFLGRNCRLSSLDQGRGSTVQLLQLGLGKAAVNETTAVLP